MEFTWDEWNIEHIARHDVEVFEVEESMKDPHKIKFDAHDQGKRGIIGRTDNGRFLTVIYTRRDDGFYVITARESTENEKKVYKRRNK